MELSTDNMDFSTTHRLPTYTSQRFRTPFSMERSLGLWVDRIGEGRNAEKELTALRLLGLYGAVHIEEGSGTFITAARGRMNVAAGDIMLLFPEEGHAYSPHGQWRTRWIVFSGSEADLLAQAGCITPAFPVVPSLSMLFDRTFLGLAGIMELEDLAAVIQRKTLLLGLIHAAYTESIVSRSELRGPGRLQDAVAYLEQHFTEPGLSIPQVAARYNLSTTHFRRLFKEMTGRSPSRYIISLKISAAKKLLADGSSLKATAQAIGIEDEFYFMRLFKKNTGCTAGAFAKEAAL